MMFPISRESSPMSGLRSHSFSSGHREADTDTPISWLGYNFSQVYGIRTRSRAVEIFTTCAHMICNMEELEKVREPLGQ